jgi:hypothetical protein
MSTINPLLPRALPPMVRPAPRAQGTRKSTAIGIPAPRETWGAKLAQRLAVRGQLNGQQSAHDVCDVVTLRHINGVLRTYWVLESDHFTVCP